MRWPKDRRYLGGSASLFGITWKVSVAIFVVRASGQAWSKGSGVREEPSNSTAEQLQPLSTNAQ